jgi:hypothetical protein
MDMSMDVRALAGGPLPDDGAFLASSSCLTRLPDDDFDLDAHIDWLVREIDEGRQHVPPESAVEGSAISVSLGDASDVDPELLAAMCGPDGLGGQAVGAAFGQDEAADVLRPGPVLAALTAQAAAGIDSLTDNELVGVLQAARRLENLAAYQQTVVIAEFARRRQAGFEAARAAGKPVGCRDGEFPGEELAMELVDTSAYAGARIDTAMELTARLPHTLAAMADGTIDLGRAMTIAARTRVMADEDAAYADEVLAAVAAGLRPDQLARKAAALELKLAPDAVRVRKELARHLDQRVEARREESGNASLAGRELDTADVIASKAYIDAIAIKLRESGLVPGTLPTLRALALVDLTQGRDPLDRITPRPVGPAGLGGHDPGPGNGPGWDDEAGSALFRDVLAGDPDDGPGQGPAGPAGRVPVPALINLLVPAGTLLGWDTAPAQAAGWGLLDPGETSALIQAASQHPRTRWCLTLIVIFSSGVRRSRDLGRRVADSVVDAMAAALSGWFQGAGSLPDRVREDLWSPSAWASWRRSRALSSARAWLRWRAAASLARRELSVGRWAAGMAPAVLGRPLPRSRWTWLRMSGWV